MVREGIKISLNNDPVVTASGIFRGPALCNTHRQSTSLPVSICPNYCRSGHFIQSVVCSHFSCFNKKSKRSGSLYVTKWESVSTKPSPSHNFMHFCLFAFPNQNPGTRGKGTLIIRVCQQTRVDLIYCYLIYCKYTKINCMLSLKSVFIGSSGRKNSTILSVRAS